MSVSVAWSIAKWSTRHRAVAIRHRRHHQHLGRPPHKTHHSPLPAKVVCSGAVSHEVRRMSRREEYILRVVSGLIVALAIVAAALVVVMLV
jgi:hypothetical protein